MLAVGGSRINISIACTEGKGVSVAPFLLFSPLPPWPQRWLDSNPRAENTKGGNITVLLTSCLTGLDYSVLQIKTKTVSCHTADSKTSQTGGHWYSDTPPFSIPCLELWKLS